MAEKYLPLQKMDELQENIELLDVILKKLYEHGFPKVNYDEYIEIILKLYMHDLDSSTFGNIMKIILMTFGEYFQSLGYFEDSFVEHPENMMGEIMDCILTPYILNIWRKNKQVYKPDNEFCNALLKTENLKLTRDMMLHLPCKHFYVDLSNCELFYPIQGIFVNVFLYEDTDKVSLTFYLIDKDLVTWSSYDVLNFDKEKEISISQKYYKGCQGENNGDYILTDYKEIGCSEDCAFVEKIISNKSEGITDKLDRYEASFFIYQLLTYMVSYEPQIEESPTTKSTYRPPKPGATIKNKFSEIQIHDVGIRFGKSFREQKKRNSCTTILTKHLEQTRKSPIPHFRAAHWQGYWVGRGRTEHVVKWIEPIFVGGEQSNDVVIHKI